MFVEQPMPRSAKHNVYMSEVFKSLALWADTFYKLICPSVCLCVCVSVCSLLRYNLNIFWPPLPKVGCPIFLEIPNPFGKVVERISLIFFWKWSKIAQKKKFFVWLTLPYKTWWKPRFPVD